MLLLLLLTSKYEDLRIQNKSNSEQISLLTKQVNQFENEAKRKKTLVSVSVVSQNTLKCELCSYPSKDLGDHQYQCHGPDDETKENPIVCNIYMWLGSRFQRVFDKTQERQTHTACENLAVLLKRTL